jgi:hypothetical protein
VLLGACQGQETAAMGDAPSPARTTTYIYGDQMLVGADDASPHGADDAAIDRLFAEHPSLARLTRSSEPHTVYLFDSYEASVEKQKSWAAAAPAAPGASTQGDLDPSLVRVSGAEQIFNYATPTFWICEDFLLTGLCVDVLDYAVWNTGTRQYEIRDLRSIEPLPGKRYWRGALTKDDTSAAWPEDWNGELNDQISSLGGGYNPGDPTQSPFAVVVWQDPNRGGASWTIVIDAIRPTFYDGNIHDNRMTSSHSWGDNISSIYVKAPAPPSP